MLEVSELVRNKALAVGAGPWLDELPELVAQLEQDWELTVGSPFGDGTEALVAPAVLADGSDAVLKLLLPRAGDISGAAHEITVLQLAGGEGCASLLRHDRDRGALLLERLGPSLHELGLPLVERHAVLCDAASRVWRPAPGCGLPTGAEKGRWLVDFITTAWEELGRPCSEAAVGHALRCAERRIAAHDEERAVLVHGDVHEWNVLQATEGFKLIDPDGLLAEPEYDLGVIMREAPVELLRDDPWERARWLGRRTGLDVTAIWEWAVVERVSTGLVCTSIGLQPLGQDMLRLAEQLAASG